MGLDLCVEGCAKPGFEDEWRRILERFFRDAGEEGDSDRFAEISIPAYQNIGAPRVGEDPAADAWMTEASGLSNPDEIAELLEDNKGYYALKLVQCDGLPKYTHAGLYEGLDDTSFRGSFLSDCKAILPEPLIDEAWEHKLPEEAIDYGNRLLAALNDDAISLEPKRKGLLARLGLGKSDDGALSLNEQREIVEAAGRWHVFWGERGHAIRAWF